MNSGKVFLGVLAGFAAGATLGVLFGPKNDKGRKLVAKKTDELMDAINEKIEQKFGDIMRVMSDKMKKPKSADKISDEH